MYLDMDWRLTISPLTILKADTVEDVGLYGAAFAYFYLNKDSAIL